jgi:hypothetical protein
MESKEFQAKLTKIMFVLIPKDDNPISMKDYRPIALCNVLYKIMVKFIANILSGILPEIISPTQTDFIPRRSITNNVVIAFETIHHIK